MNSQQFFSGLRDFFATCEAISRKKNADYATDTDPFANFRASALYGIDPAQAILIRMSDKMSRIGRLLKHEANVKDESIQDSLHDLANYAAILALYLELDKRERGV